MVQQKIVNATAKKIKVAVKLVHYSSYTPYYLLRDSSDFKFSFPPFTTIFQDESR